MTNNKRTKQSAKAGQNRQIQALTKQLKSMKTGRKKPNTPFADVGSHLGGIFGMKDFGKGVGGVIGRILGSGDYLTNFDSVSNNTLTSPVPSFGNERTTITHREYIGDVISHATPGSFKLDRYRINPAEPSTFPWLATMATNFEEYTLDGMIFEFKTTSGNSVASTNTSLGTVVLATQYDPTRAAFTNKQEMENHYFAQSTVPSNSVLHAIECKKGEAPLSRLYIADVTDASYDPRFSDFGNFSVATVGVPGASTNLGELWISYKITLSKPRLSDSHGGKTAKISRSGCTPAAPLGVTAIYVKGTLAPVVTTTTIAFQAQPGDYYMVSATWTGGAALLASPGLTVTNGAVVSSQWINNTGFIVSPGNGGTSVSMGYNLFVRASSVTGVSQMTLNFGAVGTYPTATNYLDLIITDVTEAALV